MSKRKPLSAEEKQTKLLELFHETNDVFQLKDLERIAPKEKGVVMQSVKGILQELVNNGLVECEKIAGSFYYWSFPSENLKKLQRELEDVELKTSQIQKRIDELQAKLQEANGALDDQESIEALTKEIHILQEEKDNLAKQEAKYSSNINYEEVRQKDTDAKHITLNTLTNHMYLIPYPPHFVHPILYTLSQKILEAANRWTDNIYMIKTWCKRKFDKEDRELNKAFGIPDDLDYVDMK
ncbi:meiotic nuclear division protein 1 homolog [Musca vetustissima]|uniref:meiotic nuclear division protein 1 homolog n=1 Tax=Musca vetustissima TaxID=27455 RepID=UPI002AB6953F|nr:meiotic nuclear division protein 1 homolog [Musca vetustissima]